MIKKIFISLFLCTTLFAQRELVNKRTYTSRTFKTGNAITTEIHAGHIHYKNGNSFEPVDYTLEDMGTYWRMVKANYNLYIAKSFGTYQLIRFENRYNGASHNIYYEPHSLQWVHKTTHDRILIKAAQSVTGSVSGQTITYANAFGNNVDFVIQLKRHGFVKYIRFNVKPTLTPPSADYVPVLITKYTGTGLTVKANDLTDWNGDSYYESEEGFSLSEVNPALKSYIHRAWIKDADDNRQQLKLYWEKRDSVLWQAKVLPKTFLANAVYPVTADSDIYVDGGDANATKFDNATAPYWDTVHDATSSLAPDSTFLSVQSFTDGAVPTFAQIRRSWLMFNTGAYIPAAATITAASLNLYCISTSDLDNDAQAYITICQTGQATVNSIVAGDFDLFLTDVDNIVEAVDPGQQKDITNLSLIAYTVFTFNATGINFIAKNGETKPATASASGWTQLGVQEGHDVEDDPAIAQSRANFYPSEEAGLAKDPFLSVTYKIPQVILINMN